jgi:tRNA (cytidine/uridine-2'-O-)-methyltransferase
LKIVSNQIENNEKNIIMYTLTMDFPLLFIQKKAEQEDKRVEMQNTGHELSIVLVEPEIPPNTGNIARTCAATGAGLHLVKPLGFSIDDAQVKRAGLDYWKFVNLEIHENLEEFLEKYKDRPMYLATTKGIRVYTDVRYERDAMLIFGRETAGLPKDFLKENIEKTIRIPMSDNVKLRSLNLSNSAAIVIYEALRQLGFPKLI